MHRGQNLFTEQRIHHHAKSSAALGDLAARPAASNSDRRGEKTSMKAQFKSDTEAAETAIASAVAGAVAAMNSAASLISESPKRRRQCRRRASGRKRWSRS